MRKIIYELSGGENKRCEENCTDGKMLGSVYDKAKELIELYGMESCTVEIWDGEEKKEHFTISKPVPSKKKSDK